MNDPVVFSFVFGIAVTIGVIMYVSDFLCGSVLIGIVASLLFYKWITKFAKKE